jgi:shikimate kinase
MLKNYLNIDSFVLQNKLFLHTNSMLMHNKIVFVGYSGSGKSTIAKQIAKYFNFSVLDTDKMLEEKYKISVSDTFDKYGETVFRHLEYKTLIEALQQENVVIATGGGSACFLDAMRLINESSLSIYIEMSPKSLTQRLLYAKIMRPLIKNKTENELLTFVIEQLVYREPIYKQAHLTVRGEDFDLQKCIEVIKKSFK